MKIRLVLFLSVVLSIPVLGGEVATNDDLINVKDYGAIGNGLVDDTAAINAAAKAVFATYRVTPTDSAGVLFRTKELFFPIGVYLISDTIRIEAASISIRSEGGATIKQSNDVPIFIFGHPAGYGSQKVKIRGLQFLHGSVQLYFTNKNANATMIKIEDCEFRESSDYAIKTIGIDGDLHLSAIITIENSKFYNVAGVLDNYCDQAVLRDSWVQIAPPTLKANTGIFYNRSGSLTLDHMLGVPGITANDPEVSGVHWVKMDGGNLYVSHSRFGGEGGGYPIVSFDWNGTSGSMKGSVSVYPFMGPSIVIENSQISAGRHKNPNAAVINVNQRLPHLIRLVGNNHLIGSPYIKLNNVPGTTNYINSIPKQLKARRQLFSITLGPNMALGTGGIPPLLRPFLKP